MDNQQISVLIKQIVDEREQGRDRAWNVSRLRGIPALHSISDAACREVLDYILTGVSKADDIPAILTGLLVAKAESKG